MKFLTLIFLLPCLLFSQIVETFYGSLDVNEPVLLELIESPSFQRLKEIHQYGVSYYDGTHDEEYTRYDHSLGVFAILRMKGCSLEEQIAGLLHDVSHTVFSHVGDWIFGKEHKEKDYQNSIHEKFLKETELAGILSKHGFIPNRLLPLEEYFPALEKPLPDLCADRIEYNIQGAFHKGFITKEEALVILDDLQFVDNYWVCKRGELIEKVVRFSLFMTKNCWGGAVDQISSRLLADAILKAVEIKLITDKEIHFSTDAIVWKKLSESKDTFIHQRMKALSQVESLFQLLEDHKKADIVVKPKFRGIDPLISSNGKRVRLTSINPQLAEDYNQYKKEIETGWAIKYLPGVPKN